MGFDYFKAPRSLFAVREGERRIRRSYPMELLEGASEWLVPERKMANHNILSEVFPFGGPLSIWGEFTLMSSCFDGCRWAEDSRTGPQTRIKKRWKPENSPGAGRNLSFTFFVSEASVGVEARGSQWNSKLSSAGERWTVRERHGSPCGSAFRSPLR